MCECQVKLCDPLVTHGPYLSALEIKGLYIEHYINLSVFYFLLVSDVSINLVAAASTVQ